MLQLLQYPLEQRMRERGGNTRLALDLSVRIVGGENGIVRDVFVWLVDPGLFIPKLSY